MTRQCSTCEMWRRLRSADPDRRVHIGVCSVHESTTEECSSCLCWRKR